MDKERQRGLINKRGREEAVQKQEKYVEVKYGWQEGGGGGVAEYEE